MFQIKFKKFTYTIVGFIMLFFTGCGGGSGGGGGSAADVVLHPGDIVSLTKTATYTPTQMAEILNDMHISSPIVYGIETFLLIYKTVDQNGNVINASGLLAIPLGLTLPTALISDQHGTIFSDDEAPSNNPLNASVILMTAMKGFILAMPDYIGFGASSDKLHPYLIEKPSATAVMDMIRAVRKYCASNNIPLNDKLFLSGYSEGGYVTMATLKEMEEKYADEFKVTAAAPMAGPYDLKATTDFTLFNSMLNYSPFVADVVYSYNEYYGWNRLKEIINEPYADKLASLFDGDKKGDDIFAQLTNMTSQLFRPDFLAGYFSDGEQEIKNALAENSVHNWTPKSNMRIIHCDHDPIVPYFNAQNAFENFIANGSKNVELITLEGDDHVECAGPSYLQTVSWFETLRY